MQKPPILVLLLSSSLLACADHGALEDPDAVDDAPVIIETDADIAAHGVKIQIATERAPLLLKFRDGNGAWQDATAIDANNYEARVHGPYLVQAVCEQLIVAPNRSHPHAFEYLTWEVGRTPRDARTLHAPCDQPAQNGVAGPMAQAGTVRLGDFDTSSSATSWMAILYPAGGVRDLIATTDAGILIRRGVALQATGENPLLAPIDVAQDGAAFATQTFTATNASPGDVLTATVRLTTPSTRNDAPIYVGGLAGAKVAPSSVLLSTDAQTAEVSASNGAQSRSVLRPYAASATSFALPDPIEGVAWSVVDGQQAVAWSALPSFDEVAASIDGRANDSDRYYAVHRLNLSRRYVEATAATQAMFHTDAPGYDAAWTAGLQAHTRRVAASRAQGAAQSTSASTESVAAP